MNFRRTIRLVPAAALALLCGSASAWAQRGGVAQRVIPGGEYRPLVRAANDAAAIPVPTYWIDEYAVTNAEFLEFVRAHPRWRRSTVIPLMADSTYLQNWSGDLELGPAAAPEAPVVNVSWFAASAFARSVGGRLPSLAEWERASAAGYTTSEGRSEPAFSAELYAWLSRPHEGSLAPADSPRPNFLGVRGLHGLVWEWVEDFDTAMVTGESRADGAVDQNLFCGGAAALATDTADYAAFMRQALRSSLRAREGTALLGFRCAYDSPSNPSP